MSQTAMDVFATVLVLAVAYVAFKAQQQGSSFRSVFYSVGIDWLFPLWLLVLGIGFFLAIENDPPWAMRLLEFRWIILLYCLVSALILVKPEASVVRPAAIFFSLFSLYAIVVYYVGIDPLKENHFLSADGGMSRAGGFFANPMTFAHSYGQVFCWFFGVGLAGLKWREQNSLWCILAIVISGLALLLSFTRGAQLGIAVAVVVMGMVYRLRGGLGIAALLGAFGYSLFKFWPQFHDRVVYILNPMSYDHERLTLWVTNLRIWKESPIFGIGYGENGRRLAEYYAKFQVPSETLIGHAHNQFLHFLAGTGLVGLIVYLVLIIYFLVLSIRVWRVVSIKNTFHQGLVLGCLGSQIMFHIGSLTEANFEHSKVRLVLIFSWAMIVWLAYEYKVLRQRI